MSGIPAAVVMIGVVALVVIAMALAWIAFDVNRIADVAERESEDLDATEDG